MRKRLSKVKDQSSQLNNLFFALSDPTRREILRDLLEKDCQIKTLASRFEITMPAILKHLRVLEVAKLVQINKIGRTNTLKIDLTPLSDASLWLETLDDKLVNKRDWEARIEANIEEIEKETGRDVENSQAWDWALRLALEEMGEKKSRI